MDVVTCAVCGRQFDGLIGWKHFASHNLTTSQYKALYPNNPIATDLFLQRRKLLASAHNEKRKGIPRSAETKSRMSSTKKLKNKPAWNKGIARTAEQKLFMSEIMRKRILKQGSLRSGAIVTAETRQKISDKLKGRAANPNALLKREHTINAKKENGWIHHSRDPEHVKRKQIKYIQTHGHRPNQDHFSADVLSKINNPEWLYNQHITLKKPITSICVELGLHWKNSNKSIKNALIRHNIPITYHTNQSQGESSLYEFVKQLVSDAKQRDRTLIYPLELDIILPTHKIAIEYCGLYWHSTAHKHMSSTYHLSKLVLCKSRGYRLITIYEDEWLKQRDIVENILRHILRKSQKNNIHARKCELVVINNQQIKSDFFNTNHIQGVGPGSITYALKYKHEIVGMMSFINNGNNEYTLNRYASNAIVKGGFSKLMHHFITIHHPDKIISFADLRYSEGDVYLKNGFCLDKLLPPDYSYIRNGIRHHKFNFRRKYLPQLLDKFDPSKSEVQNCEANKIFRIYNCGLMRFVWNSTK